MPCPCRFLLPTVKNRLSRLVALGPPAGRLAVLEITNMPVLDTLVFVLFHARLRDLDFKAQDDVMETIRPSPLIARRLVHK